MRYEITPTDQKIDLKTYRKVPADSQFLHESLRDQISAYENKNNSSKKIYSLLGFSFQVIKAENASNTEINNPIKQKNSETYRAYLFDKELTDNEISQILRGSKTLAVDSTNSYDNTDIKAVFAEGGFVVNNKLFNISADDKFHRFLLLFLLALAYNQQAEKFLQEVSYAHKKKKYRKMVNARNNIYNFDLNYYFFNPVRQKLQQTYKIWEIISRVYNVKPLHDEIKSQVVDLANIIEADRKDTIELLFMGVGTLIGIASLVSVFKDLQELYGFDPNAITQVFHYLKNIF